MSELLILNDRMLAARMAGDAVDAAVREHARLVYRISYCVLRNHQDAEDASQETFLRGLRYRRKLEEVRDPRCWVAGIAWRVATERRCAPARVGLEETGDVIDRLRSSVASADEALLGNVMAKLLGRLMAGLPHPVNSHPLAIAHSDVSPFNALPAEYSVLNCICKFTMNRSRACKV